MRKNLWNFLARVDLALNFISILILPLVKYGHWFLLSNLQNTETEHSTLGCEGADENTALKMQKDISGHVTTWTQRQCAALHINLFTCQGLSKILSTSLAACPRGGMCMWQSAGAGKERFGICMRREGPLGGDCLVCVMPADSQQAGSKISPGRKGNLDPIDRRVATK